MRRTGVLLLVADKRKFLCPSFLSLLLALLSLLLRSSELSPLRNLDGVEVCFLPLLTLSLYCSELFPLQELTIF